MVAPEDPPLCRETSVSRTANVGTVGKNRWANSPRYLAQQFESVPPVAASDPRLVADSSLFIVTIADELLVVIASELFIFVASEQFEGVVAALLLEDA